MRLIDADRLKKKVLKWLPSDPCGIEGKEHPIETDIVVSLMMEIEEAPTVNEWIPVSEALPSEGQVVLAIGDKGTWDVGKFQGTAGWTEDERRWNWKKKSVKHVEYWMPKDAIPLPKREDGE